MRITFGFLTLLLVSSLAFAQGVQPMKSDGATDVSKSSDGKLKIQLRPLVRQIAPHDPLRVGLHFTPPDGKLDAEREFGVMDLPKTLGATKFIITTPAGKRHELTAEITDKRGESWRGPQSIFRFASPMLWLDATGLACPGPYGDINGKWTGPAPDFSRSGKYTLELQGELVGNGAKFATGKIAFEVSMAAQPLKQAFEKAHVALKKNFPEVDFSKMTWTESGYMPGLVFEDEKDRRVLFFNAQLVKGGPWSYDLVRVTMTRTGEVAEIAHRRIGTCIAAGTPIDTPSGPQAIETLREGDKIWAFDLAAAKRVPATIRTIRGHRADATLVIGGSLRITPNHPLYVNGAWLPVGEAAEGDRLLSAAGQPIAIGEIREVREPIDVFDLTVDEPHNYFAGGFLVHNKDRAWRASLDDTWEFYWPETPPAWTVD